MKNIFYLFFLSLFFIAYSSCSDNDDKEIYELTFEKNDYAVMNHSSFPTSIMIRSGNGDYTITPGDKEMIEAFYSPPQSTGFGYMVVKGLKKGVTTLNIKDNVTGEEVKLNITVTNAYLSTISTSLGYEILPSDNNKTEIQKYINDNALIKKENVLTLVNDEEKTFYVFEDEEAPPTGNYLYKGTYEFIEETDAPYLKVSYTAGGIEKNIKYEMKGNNAITILSVFFDLGWTTQKATQVVYRLDLHEDYLERLKPTYPALETAKLTTSTVLFPNLEVHLDLVK